MTKRKRLLWRLYLSYLLVTTVLPLGIMLWYTLKACGDFYTKKAVSDLEARLNLIESPILELLEGSDEKGLDEFCKKIGERAQTRITILSPSGKVLADSIENPSRMDSHADRIEFIAALSRQVGSSSRYSRTLGRYNLYVASALTKDSQPVAVLRASLPLERVNEGVKELQVKIGVSALILALVAALLSLLISRGISRPFQKLRNWAEAVSRGDFDSRPPISASEEISALSEAMRRTASELRERMDLNRRQKNEMEAMLSSMSEGVIAVDMEERIISMNHSAAQIFGCTPSEIQGRSIQEVVRNTVLHQFVRSALSSDEPVVRDIVLNLDGERYFDGHGTLLRDAEGKQIGALLVLNDVTRLKRLEAVRKDFVANVSHEIKTPITAIKGFVETLRDGAIKSPEDTARFLTIIEKHVTRLEAIIEDLLSLSRIERHDGGGELTLAKENMKAMLESAIQFCVAKSVAKKIEVELACEENLVARMDSRLMEQAVVNLLDNAINYSDEGSTVWVEARRERDEIILCIRDQGPGIEKKHLPRIFERFYRVDKSRSRQNGGTGLGLAIVKHIALAHGGRVSVESAPGKGSSFCVHLPTS